MKDKCRWQQEDEDSGAWHTDCGNAFWINEGTPEENGIIVHSAGSRLRVFRTSRTDSSGDQWDSGWAKRQGKGDLTHGQRESH